MDIQLWNDGWADTDVEYTDLAPESIDVAMEPTETAIALLSTESDDEVVREYDDETEAILWIEVLKAMCDTVKQLVNENLNYARYVSDYANDWSSIGTQEFPAVLDLPGFTMEILFSWGADLPQMQSNELFEDDEVIQGIVNAVLEAWKYSDELNDCRGNYERWVLERRGLQAPNVPIFNFRAVVEFQKQER